MRGVPRWLAVLAVSRSRRWFALSPCAAPWRLPTFVMHLSDALVAGRRFLLHGTDDSLLEWPRSARPCRCRSKRRTMRHVESLTVDGPPRQRLRSRSGVLPGEANAHHGARLRVAGNHVCGRRPTTATRSAMARQTSCGCTILPTGWRSATGSPCWPSRSITAANRCRRRLTTAPPCCASPIARPCANTMRPGRMPWRCPRLPRRAISGSINIPTRRWEPRCFACAVAALGQRPARRRFCAVRRRRDAVAA